MNVVSPPSDPTVQYLIGDLYHDLGIPHFQRGLVWNDDNTSLLLESLYFDTPCGTIILWKPEEPGEHGIPLLGSDKPQYWVIDGQQRIRSLRGALGPENGRSAQSTSDEEGDDTEPNARRVWCLNLSRVPELAGFFDPSMSRYPMFCLIADPTRQGARFKHNFIPLYLFFGDQDADIHARIKPANAATDEVVQQIKEIHLRRRIGQLRERQVFFLKTLRESQDKNENRLADVVALYNRINSAGKRVESEEKAFATLVSLYSPTNERLGQFFHAVHPPDEHDHPEGHANNLERDDILERRKERNFGFKLFIRTFIQVYAYRFGYSPGSNSFSFEVVNSLPFQMRLKNNTKEIERLFDRTDKVVRFVRWDILHDGLKCDDLQTLPDTMSLLPLFQLLIRFPDLIKPEMNRYAPVLSCLALRLLLVQNPSQEKIFKLVNEVNRAETAKDCLEKLHRSISQPADLREHLSIWLKDSNTLMDRYVLMLYWLLRKEGARDFSYKNLNETKRLWRQQGQEVALEEGVEPEKQHIVPYSLLKKLYNIEERGRVSRHPSNNIGNITYISHELNDYETGLGSDPIDLKWESPENREHHFLGADGEVRKSYENAKEMAKNANDTATQAFEEFCKCRRELIAEAFVKWVEELAPELTISEEVKPALRVDPSLWDRVRRLDCPDDIEDAMLEMITSGQLQLRTWRSKKTSAEKWVGRVSSPPDKGFIIRVFDDRLEVEPAADSPRYEALQNLMVDKGVSRTKQGVKDGNWVLQAQGENAVITSEILIEFGQQLSGIDLVG